MRPVDVLNERTSHRQILRSTSIIGGASIINILVGMARTKVAATLLGPAGVGLVGLLQNVLATSAAAVGLGLGPAGTRQIAAAVGARDDIAAITAGRAVFWGTLTMAMIGGGLMWLLRRPLAAYALGDTRLSGDIGWLSLGLTLTVCATSQNAVLSGLRRIDDLARITILSTLLASLAGVGALVWFGRGGLIAYVIAVPLALVVVSQVYVARLPTVAAPPTPLPELARQWRILARLGGAMTFAGLAGAGSQLAVNDIIKGIYGISALGEFQAAFTISMTYVGLVLGAMGADYYPRLAAAIHDHTAVNRMVNEQTEVALLLAGPVFVAIMGLSPWLISILYSSQFTEAPGLLRWQIAGDILKVASWPLGFLILAAGDGRTYVITETLAACIFAVSAYILLPALGVQGASLSFILMYVTYLPIAYVLANRRTGFSWTPAVAWQFAIVLGLSGAVMSVAKLSTVAAAIGGLVAAGMLVGLAIWRLGQRAALPSSLSFLNPRP